MEEKNNALENENLEDFGEEVKEQDTLEQEQQPLEKVFNEEFGSDWSRLIK